MPVYLNVTRTQLSSNLERTPERKNLSLGGKVCDMECHIHDTNANQAHDTGTEKSLRTNLVRWEVCRSCPYENRKTKHDPAAEHVGTWEACQLLCVRRICKAQVGVSVQGRISEHISSFQVACWPLAVTTLLQLHLLSWDWQIRDSQRPSPLNWYRWYLLEILPSAFFWKILI
jgi:hypothetical protein